MLLLLIIIRGCVCGLNAGDVDALLGQIVAQLCQRITRCQMRLGFKEQPTAVAIGQCRFKLCDHRRISWLMLQGAAGKPIQLFLVPAQRQHQRALFADFHAILLPPTGGLAAKSHHRFLGCLALTKGCQHAACPP